MVKKILTVLFLFGAFATLIKLGLWQVERMQWKEEILTQIAVQEQTDPTTAPLNLQNPHPFQRGYLNGQIMTDKGFIRLAPRTLDGNVGAHILRPFQTEAGDYILVNEGWVADTIDYIPATKKRYSKIIGHLRMPEKAGMFVPPNHPENNLWYSVNIAEASAFYGVPLADVIFYREDSDGAIVPFQGLPKPRNKHFQYAVFWFGMAGLLVVLMIFRLRPFKKVK